MGKIFGGDGKKDTTKKHHIVKIYAERRRIKNDKSAHTHGVRFESIEDVDVYFDNDSLECFECGRSYKNLAAHIGQAHHYITNKEYKEKYNIPYMRGLFGRATREKASSARKAAWKDPVLGSAYRKHIEEMAGTGFCVVGGKRSVLKKKAEYSDGGKELKKENVNRNRKVGFERREALRRSLGLMDAREIQRQYGVSPTSFGRHKKKSSYPKAINYSSGVYGFHEEEIKQWYSKAPRRKGV